MRNLCFASSSLILSSSIIYSHLKSRRKRCGYSFRFLTTSQKGRSDMMKAARQIMPHLKEEPKVSSLYFAFPAKQQTSRSPSASGIYCPHVDVSLPYAASSNATSTIPLSGPLSTSTYPHSPSSPNAIIPTDTEDKLRLPVQIVPQHTPSFQKPDTPQDPHPTRSRRKYKLVN